MSDTAFVTSHLCVGAEPQGISGPIIHTSDPQAAAHAIQMGKTAVLPQGAYDTAAQVMRLLGANSQHIDFQIRLAKGDIHPLSAVLP